jgi:alpha-beta hydrolase superfamily lysophospholipase
MVFAAIGIVALVVAAAYAFLVFYRAESFTRSKRRRVVGTPADVGLRYEEVQFLTADRLTLHGWFLESPGARATILMLHDRDGTRADDRYGVLELQRDYVRRGYHVFAFDLRGRGESAGGRDHLGDAERRDVSAAVTFVRRRGGALPIILHGFGFGASLAIWAAGNDVAVDGVIADSPFSSMREHLRDRHPHGTSLLFRSACLLARRVFSSDVDALAPVSEMAALETPVMFIHSEHDDVVPVSHSLNLAAASMHEDNEMWTIDEFGGHCTYYLEQPHEYVRRCLSFIDRVVPVRLFAVEAG